MTRISSQKKYGLQSVTQLIVLLLAMGISIAKTPLEYLPLRKSTLLLLASFTAAILLLCIIVYNCNGGRQQYICFNKENNYYFWEYQGKGFIDLDKKIDWLKNKKLWKKLQDYYIEKKNSNENPDKHSRSIFAESINEMCQKNGYHK